MDVQLQRTIREHEVEQITPLLPRGGIILEIGAGAGWQAKKIAEHGFQVTAIDLPGRALAKHSVYDIAHYDGHKIPFPSEYFDAVFTSNVMDHIPHVREFQKEIHRVLKPSGMVIHVLPTTSWRLWTILTHYPYQVKQVGLLIVDALTPGQKTADNPTVEIRTHTLKHHAMEFLTKILIVPRLGERGNSMSELYLFSARHRRAFFSETGWSVHHRQPNELFYSG